MRKIDLKNILEKSKTLHNLRPELPDDFPSGGGGGGGTGSGGGGTGGGGSGTTSANTLPYLSISPNTNQSIATGTTICFNASGSASFPQEAEQNAQLLGGCSASSTGNWIKSCGTNGQNDAPAFDPSLIYRKRPFQFTARNNLTIRPAPPFSNIDIQFGVRTTGGYVFYWGLSKYCGVNANCDSRWIGTIVMSDPTGVQTTFVTGYVEFNQLFRMRSDGNTLSWDYTTYNRWIYNRYYITIPSDVGSFQFFINAGWLGNAVTGLKTFKGSYQGSINPEDYLWTSDCVDNLVVAGDKACYTPLTPGYCKVCVSTVDLEPKCVAIVSSPLTLNPTNTDCKTCGNQSNECDSIPDPTTPIVTLESTSNDSININWNPSISFTNGLYYEIDVNGNIQTTLDTNAIINSLTPDTYTISVRAIDACGFSDWSAPKSINLGSLVGNSLQIPQNFQVYAYNNESDNYSSDLTTYQASWSAIDYSDSGQVSYEIWGGDPQSDKLVLTSSTSEILGSLPSKLKLSIRAKDSLGAYSSFSDFVTIP